MAGVWSLTARWVFPVEGGPLERGMVRIDGDRVAAVEPAGTRTADADLGDVAVLPGLANAHTHLDLTGLHGRCPPTRDFTAWLRCVIDHRRRQTPEQVQADISSGLQQSLRAGVTLIGDISAGGASWPVLAAAPVRATVYYELLGLTEARAAQAIEAAGHWLNGVRPTDTCRPGLSPHAPYSVRRSLFAWAAGAGVPVAVHLGETREELQLLESRSGPFVDFLKELGVWDPAGLVSGPAAVYDIFRRGSPLFAHGNYLDPAVVPRAAAVAYCPRTHAAFGHDPHPVEQLLAAGRAVALGTDSLASNPDLSLLEEGRFLYRERGLPGDALLQMMTLAGAAALGREAEAGSLAPGKSADLVVLPLPNKDFADPHGLIFESDLPPSRVLFRGEWVAGPGGG